MCGFVGDVLGGIVDVIGSVAEFVVDNALPIISTVALNYFAPGIGTYFSISETAVKAIGGAAISALNGGSIADIATAGLTPYLPSIGKSLGINLDPTGFISSTIADVLGDNVVSSVISNAVGSATMAGLTAAVTGGDILKAAGMAGFSSAVGTSLSKTWDAIKEYAPKMSLAETEIQTKYNRVQDSQGFIDQVRMQQNIVNDLADEMNAPSAKYQQLKSNYDTKLAEYNVARDARDVTTANSIAKELNENIIPTINDFVNNYGDFSETYATSTLLPQYEQAKSYLDSLINNNQGLIDTYIDDVTSLDTLTKQYETFTNKIQADYSNFQMADALSKGDYDSATKYFTDLNNYNQAILSVEPNTTVTTPSLTPQQNTFLQEFASATDQAVKEQLTSQASQLFADYKAPISTDTTVPTTPTTPTETTPTPPTDTTTGTSTNPYDQLPKLPEDGIGQPTPPAPSTGTGTTGTSTTPSTGSNLVNYLTNVGSNVLGNITKGVVTNQVVNAILGNDPERPSLPTKPRPPSKVDVSTLKPFTGNLPSNVTAGVTPTQTDPTKLTPIGGLPTTGGATTTPTTPTNTTQTPTGGLQSTQTQTPPNKVDVSKLTPVTDMNWLKSLGIVQG